MTRGDDVGSMGDVRYMERPLYCAFCGRERALVDMLVTGCTGVCICDECIDSSAKILRDWREQHKDENRDCR